MSIKLYDLVKMSEADYDTYDTVYDAEVTVCFIEEDESNDDYDKFCIELMKKVEVEKINGDTLTVKWTKLITDNMENFKDFTKEHWYDDRQYEDDEDEFIYQWISEIHYYLAGYVSENMYETLVKFVNTLKS